ncbi:aldehyde dehydrogenase family protein [Sinomonas flava]|uniref:aldehyde dehydrogenase family protein n=1 Tax=Sinomonas flava TaxID=496857 RepID=UPI0039A4402A
MIDNVVTADPSTSRKLTPEVRRGLLGLGLGNALEWYDWMVFGLLSAYIGPNFFRSQEPLSATLNTLAVFAVGFAFRPLGGVILGTVADRIGRRRVMLLSIVLMAVTTLVIAVTPGYAAIGAWAGVILLVCRCVQGISTGIEAPLSTSHAVELAPPGREGMVAGLMSFYVNLGILMASLVSFASSLMIGGAAMGEWGWRVPFIVGSLFGFVVVYLRRSLPETMRPEELAAAKTSGVWSGIRRHWLAILAIIFVVGAAQAYNYAWNVGLPTAARSSFKEDPTAVFALMTALAVVLVVGSWAYAPGEGLAGARMGAVVSEAQFAQDAAAVRGAVERGAELLAGAHDADPTGGLFFPPAVLAGMAEDDPIVTEEVFGPVAAVLEVPDYEAGLAAVNSSRYGLTAGICTDSLALATDFAARAQAGVVKVNRPTSGLDLNAPFGGVKDSSTNTFREQGRSAVEFYTWGKTVYLGV